jgi:TfoX/Sxy family transcriptional regulator of competence genes
VKKSEDELVELVKQNLIDVDYVEKKMFGKFAYFINRNMFTGVHQSYLFLRLSSEDREEALSQVGITVFEPRAGLIMREYVVLTDAILSNRPILTELFQKSVSYVSSLPPKEPKKKKKK